MLREALPWRDDQLTECGRPVSDVASWITRDQLVWRVKEHGQQRTAFTVCMTCFSTAQSHGETWETHPSALISRELRRGSDGIVYNEYDRNTRQYVGPLVDLLSAELHALAELIAEHREEFDQRVTRAKEGALFAHRRRQAERKKKGAR